MSNQANMVLQVGKESVWGTLVAATSKLRGLRPGISFQPIAEVELLEQQWGSFGPTDLAVLNANGMTASIPGWVLYEDDPYWMDALFGVVTPSGGPAYIYAHAAPIATMPVSPRIMSVEYGDKISGGPNYNMKTAITTKIAYKGESKKTIEFQSDLIGLAPAAMTLTAALTDRVVEPVHGSQLVVYVDTWAGTIGTTALVTSAIAFELTIDARRNMGFYFGSLPALDFDEGDLYDVTLKCTLKFNSTSKTLFESIIGTSVSQRQIRLKATSGTKVWQKDIAGTFTEAPKMWDLRNGSHIVNFTLKGTYNLTFGNYFKSSVTNAVATLP